MDKQIHPVYESLGGQAGERWYVHCTSHRQQEERKFTCIFKLKMLVSSGMNIEFKLFNSLHARMF